MKYRNSFKKIYLDHGVNVAFGTGELCRIFNPDQDHEIEVMPHVVLVTDVILEAHCLVIELGSIQSF